MTFVRNGIMAQIHKSDIVFERVYFTQDQNVCFDCGVCEPECPAEAILPDTETDAEKWLEPNREYSEKWPNITRMGDVPADSDKWKDVPNKWDEHFSPEPGKGD